MGIWSRGIRSQTGGNVCDVGLSGALRLVWLSWDWIRSPGASSPDLWSPRVLLYLMSRGGEARLWRSVSKVGTFGLGRHVLHLCWAANRLLAVVVASGGLVLRARLGGPHLDVEGGLTGGRCRGVGGWNRLRSHVALRLGYRADRGRWDSPLRLRFGHCLLGRSQRRLVGNDHALITRHRGIGGRACGGAGILQKGRNVPI